MVHQGLHFTPSVAFHTASPTATRDASLRIPSSRKEGREVSDHHSVRNPRDEDLGQPKLGESDERRIYEHGREPVDLGFCSVTVDGSLGNDMLQQRIHSISRQREELQQIEIDLRAQAVARSEISDIQNSYNTQIKEHIEAASKFQEQLREREQTIHDLERRIEDKDREIKLDNEAAWAKEDLLREQNKELASFRRERDHSEAERVKHIQQIHDLQEHIQEKERQILELQELHRVDQETIFLKDEQLKVWIGRVKEMDALQTSANHSFQAEIRQRTEQYNQLWLGCQRQFGEMERLHLHSLQQLQKELVEARERGGSYLDGTHISQTKSNDVPKLGQKNGSEPDVNGSGASSTNTVALANGNTDIILSLASSGNVSSQSNQVAGVPFAPSSLIGMPTYLPPAQMTALHPFILHQQGIPHSMPSHFPQSHVGHFHSVPAMSPPQWQNQQAVPEGGQVSVQNHLTSSHSDHNLKRLDAKYKHEISVNGQGFRPVCLDVNINQGTEPNTVISSTGEEQKIDREYLVASHLDQSLQQISSQFNDALRLNSLEQNSKTDEQNVPKLSNQGLENQVLTEEQSGSGASPSPSENSIHSAYHNETTVNNGSGAVLSEVSIGKTNMANAAKSSENALLDERSLLACIVRTIPPGGRIRMNSTLPNRLGKMLAPLHWHDYKKKYGKLDDFLAGHPELLLPWHSLTEIKVIHLMTQSAPIELVMMLLEAYQI
ncbi:hypothetical protein K2173_005944 [Erythroxylum novogranatense]|uniref:DUF7725 domain-containing protein n=1 Tax=Erythroxylum novogranatense TaxID=1862640 RepID=A0AAV8TSJ8_9ROSI|nr:hypothetical protein K2173_005944 [Erythroxylum novogranatense]